MSEEPIDSCLCRRRVLGLSEHTVIEHLENARRRLGVKTRAQAVIEAIARGLITV